LKAAGERLAIVSALPCELYPPTVNLVRTVQQHPNINLLLICATGSAVACSIPRARAATARFSAGHSCRCMLLLLDPADLLAFERRVAGDSGSQARATGACGEATEAGVSQGVVAAGHLDRCGCALDLQ